MKASVFLRYAAHCIDEGFPVDRLLAPRGWTEYIVLTLPLATKEIWDDDELIETRVMRFLFAAAVAEEEGN